VSSAIQLERIISSPRSHALKINYKAAEKQ